MATVSEIIAGRMNAGFPIEQRVRDIRDNTPGLTEELYTNAVLDSLGQSYPWFSEKLKRTADAEIPDYKSVIALLPQKELKDDSKKNGRSTLEKFVEDFPKKQKAWHDHVLEKYPGMGEKGWQTIKKIWQQTANDKMAADIVKERDKVMEGNAEGQGMHDWIASALGTLMFPRIKKAGKEGRDPSGSEEIAGDAFSNVAYMVPAGFVGAPLKAVARKALPEILQGAGKYAASVISQATAPTAVYGMDKILGNETSWVDPVAGTLGNLGANKVLFPTIGRLGGTLLGKIRNPQFQGLRSLLEGADTPMERGRQIIDDANNFLKRSDKPNEQLVRESMAQGRNNEFTPDAVNEAQTISDFANILKAADKAKRNVPGSKLGQNEKDSWTNAAIGGMTEAGSTPKSNAEIAATAVAGMKAQQMMKSDPELQAAMKEISSTLSKKPEFMSLSTKEQREVLKDLVAPLYGDLMNGFKPEFQNMFEKNPALMATLFKDKYPKLADLALAYGMNQYSNSVAKTGKMAGGALNIPIEEWQKEDRKERKDAKASSSIKKILDAGSTLTEQDRRFLEDIRKNPDIVTVGHQDPARADEFKAWMLQRGHGLLSGTPAARPTWEVEW